MDLRTFQNPPELFTLTLVGLIEKKCLVEYVVSVMAGIVNYIVLVSFLSSVPLSLPSLK